MAPATAIDRLPVGLMKIPATAGSPHRTTPNKNTSVIWVKTAIPSATPVATAPAKAATSGRLMASKNSIGEPSALVRSGFRRVVVASLPPPSAAHTYDRRNLQGELR